VVPEGSVVRTSSLSSEIWVFSACFWHAVVVGAFDLASSTSLFHREFLILSLGDFF